MILEKSNTGLLKDVAEQDMELTIIEDVFYNKDGEKSYLNVKVQMENGDKKLTWVNDKSKDNLIDAFGADTSNWIDKKVKVDIRLSNKGKKVIILLPVDTEIPF